MSSMWGAGLNPLYDYTAPGPGSVSRPMQNKVAEATDISLADKGADSLTDSLAALNNALSSGASIEIPEGTWMATGSLVFSGSKILHARNGSALSGTAFSSLGFYTGSQGVEQFIHQGAAADDAASFYFRREANYSGGTPGFTNSGLRVDSFVRNVAATAFEWAFTATMNNWASAGENVAGYFLGRKYGTGATWGAVSEAVDHTEVANPTGGLVAHEFDLTANGTDNNAPYGSRVGLDLAVRKYNPVGADVFASWGFRIQTGTGATVDRGFSFYPGSRVLKAFDASTATVIQFAFKMGDNQTFGLSSDETKQLTYDGTGVKISNGSTLMFRANNTGVVQTGNLFTVATTPANFSPNRILEFKQRDGTSIYLAGMLATW